MTRPAVSVPRLAVLLALPLLVVLATKPAGAVTVGFDPADQTVALGSRTAVDIVVSELGGEIVSAWDLDILYDSSVVAATEVVFTTLLGDELSFEVLSDFEVSTPGVVDLAQVSLLSDGSLFGLQGGDSVVLASVLFEAVGVGTSALDLVLDEVNDFKGRLGEILPVAAVGGRIRVEGSEPAIPEPSAALLFGIGAVVFARSLRRRRARASGRTAVPFLLVPVLLAASLAAAPARAQVCTDPVVPVLSQFDADNFACSEVTGSLFISDNGSGDLTSLAGLGILTAVGGDLTIQDNPALTSLAGLENLIRVEGSLAIGDLLFGGNDSLTSLAGLEGLTSVGGSLGVQGNAALASVAALGGRVSVGADLSVIGNPALVSLTGLGGVAALDGSLTIQDNAALATLSGLEGLVTVAGNLVVDGNGVLTSMAGLDGLALVGNTVTIADNPSLTSLDGLESLGSVGVGADRSFLIRDNPALGSLEGLSGLAIVGGDLSIDDADALVSLAGLASLGSVGGLALTRNDALESLVGLDGLADSQRLVVIGNPALTSLGGAEGVTALDRLVVSENDALTSLAGLESLASLGSLEVEGNDSLVSLSGLESVTALGQNLVLSFNPVLASLAGLENVTSVGSFLQIFGNDSLVSLAGLDRVGSVGASLFVASNVALQSLSGLESLSNVGGELGVFVNEALVDCACGLGGVISGSPPAFTGVAGQVQISDNEPDGLCTSPDVVLSVPQSSCEPPALECDVDADGDVDRNDVAVIFDARGEPASGPDDPRDAYRDGMITVNDGRECALQCTLPDCRPVCGLVGIEPFLLLGYPLWRRRRAARSR